MHNQSLKSSQCVINVKKAKQNKQPPQKKLKDNGKLIFLSPHICLNMIRSEYDTPHQNNNDVLWEKAINN